MMFQRQKIVFMIVGIALFGLMLVVVFGDHGWLELRHMRAEQARLIQDNERLNRENLRLYRNIDRIKKDPEFIENAARRELGMIRKDELIFKFRSGPKSSP
jgi:cell division protein FtsB